ncbi:unnamed protein product [Sphagnum balticum]
MEIDQEDNKRYFTDFLARQAVTDPKHFCLDLDQLRQARPQVAQEVIRKPSEYYRLIVNYLERVAGEEKKKWDGKVEHLGISFEGNLGPNFVSPRGLGSKLANELVGLQGIITKMDIVKHQL